ncbi:cytochrome c3 family protein [Ferrimonas futtsuensis]|uniref:cytochrome c3 family protein n=1 Tax=Ferrimonas futtsuensis TaxID=364764 RepID=UPI00054D93A7|nr:cytochrome c3 family protein [Ferrimonas futtsuensis]
MNSLHKIVLAFALTVGAGSVMAKDATQLDEFHAGIGLTCNDCHTGAERQPVAMSKCKECHSVEDLAEATAVTPSVTKTNPHDHRHNGTATDCNSCHHQHEPSENACGSCHLRFDLQVP